jgi:hypothetical protein
MDPSKVPLSILVRELCVPCLKKVMEAANGGVPLTLCPECSKKLDDVISSPRP